MEGAGRIVLPLVTSRPLERDVVLGSDYRDEIRLLRS